MNRSQKQGARIQKTGRTQPQIEAAVLLATGYGYWLLSALCEPLPHSSSSSSRSSSTCWGSDHHPAAAFYAETFGASAFT